MKKNEKIFSKPEAEVIDFCDEDIILTSNSLSSQEIGDLTEL